MNFSSKNYLFNSEKRIVRLRNIINGRPVAILAAGPSISELEKRISELRHTDICYFGLNNFSVQETHILRKIDKHFSVILCTSRDGMPYEMESIIDFLNRSENNMFISSFSNDNFGLLNKKFSLKQFIVNYDKKLLFISRGYEKIFPNNDYPLHFIESNSLLALIQLAIIGKASSIVLFGADGHCGENAKEYYYRQNEYEVRKWPQVDLALINDTMCLFNPIAPIAIKNTCITYDLSLINILNCSKKSFYTSFLRISYDMALEYIVTGKKMIGKLDLRIPIRPKMPKVYLLAIEKIINFWEKHRWNIFNALAVKIWQRGGKIFR